MTVRGPMLAVVVLLSGCLDRVETSGPEAEGSLVPPHDLISTSLLLPVKSGDWGIVIPMGKGTRLETTGDPTGGVILAIEVKALDGDEVFASLFTAIEGKYSWQVSRVISGAGPVAFGAGASDSGQYALVLAGHAQASGIIRVAQVPVLDAGMPPLGFECDCSIERATISSYQWPNSDREAGYNIRIRDPAVSLGEPAPFSAGIMEAALEHRAVGQNLHLSIGLFAGTNGGGDYSSDWDAGPNESHAGGSFASAASQGPPGGYVFVGAISEAISQKLEIRSASGWDRIEIAAVTIPIPKDAGVLPFEERVGGIGLSMELPVGRAGRRS